MAVQRGNAASVLDTTGLAVPDIYFHLVLILLFLFLSQLLFNFFSAVQVYVSWACLCFPLVYLLVLYFSFSFAFFFLLLPFPWCSSLLLTKTLKNYTITTQTSLIIKRENIILIKQSQNKCMYSTIIMYKINVTIERGEN